MKDTICIMGKKLKKLEKNQSREESEVIRILKKSNEIAEIFAA